MKPHSPPGWTAAANAVSDILEAENAYLRASDFTAAAGLLPAKRAAIGRMALAPLAGAKQEIRNAAGRLDRLAEQNRSLLAHGIGIQAQVLGVIAGAIRAAASAGCADVVTWAIS